MKFTADEFLVKLPLGANEKWISHHPDGEERHPFASGDAFFVEAGVRHHFENFTDDFATWAIFF